MTRHFVLVPLAITSALAFAPAACITNPSLGTGGNPDSGPGSVATTTPTPDGGSSGNPGAPDSGPSAPLSCDGLLAAMLAAPLTPPNIYGSINLASGRDPKGITIDEANAAHCATLAPDSPSSGNGGYRGASWGGDDGIGVGFNMQSRILYSVTLGKNYTGTVQFQSRVGGHFGVHTYDLGIGHLKRDGADMPIDWNTEPVTWADEILDGMMATFSPSTVRGGVTGCRASGECLYLPDDGSGQSIFGARDLAFYTIFKGGTNQATGFYNFWKGGKADCSTPTATLEAMDWASVMVGFTFPDKTYGAWLGDLNLSQTQPNGITWQDADAIECNGQSVAPIDPGYGAIQWGPTGELMLEYNKTTNIAYKLIARSGYKGTLDGYDDTGKIHYSVGVGTMAKDKAAYTIDWANPLASVTELSNAVNGMADTDCVAAANCTITADDGKGHSVVEFPQSQVGVVFAKGTSTPQTVYATWDKAK